MEALSTDAGEGYIQFIRELSIKCKKNDLVLSIDNYVPSSYTALDVYKRQVSHMVLRYHHYLIQKQGLL